VLNAADPIVAGMAENTKGDITYFALDASLPVMQKHRAQGRRIVYVDKGHLVAAQGKKEERVPLAEVPITRGGVIGFQVENVMAAVAAAWAVNISWDAIRLGLKTFVGESDNAPGRFNVFDYRGATVIADYGHNPDAIQALVNAVESMPAKRRSVVISGAGDRRDEDIRDQTRILGKAFDDVLLYEDQCQRGRSEGEVVALLREGLTGATRTTHVEEIKGEFVAIDKALERLQPGDLSLILIDQVDEALAHIAKRVKAG
jgi:cyanophycin synthetase